MICSIFTSLSTTPLQQSKTPPAFRRAGHLKLLLQHSLSGLLFGQKRLARPDNSLCDVRDTTTFRAGWALMRAAASLKREACIDSPVDSWLPPDRCTSGSASGFFHPPSAASRRLPIGGGEPRCSKPDRMVILLPAIPHVNRRRKNVIGGESALFLPSCQHYVRSLFIECSTALLALAKRGTTGPVAALPPHSSRLCEQDHYMNGLSPSGGSQ